MSNYFETLCRNHDLTYEYSDNVDEWREGHESFKKIKVIAKTIDRETVRATWNKVVDAKLAEPYRNQFYWQDSWFDY